MRVLLAQTPAALYRNAAAPAAAAALRSQQPYSSFAGPAPRLHRAGSLAAARPRASVQDALGVRACPGCGCEKGA